MKHIKVFQLNSNSNNLFMSYNFVKKHSGFNLSDYTEIYSCDRPDNYSLDDVYEEFNCRHPHDFTGHSLSVSDVVFMDNKYYFCDTFGWEEIN